MLPEGMLLLERGWIMEETVVAYVEYRECKSKRV